MGASLGQPLSQVLNQVAPLLPAPPPLIIEDPLDLYFLEHLGENEVLDHTP